MNIHMATQVKGVDEHTGGVQWITMDYSCRMSEIQLYDCENRMDILKKF